LFDMAREVNRLKAEDMAAAKAMASHLSKLSAVLGLLAPEPEAFLRSGAPPNDSEMPETKEVNQQRWITGAQTEKGWGNGLRETRYQPSEREERERGRGEGGGG
ncbi:DALR domain-containing protein, partial [Escherichia coli]|uniref:DALR domain-containing protein n=1 Tax=Escherichia coli TaxID=562 RepID=UPI0027D96A48